MNSAFQLFCIRGRGQQDLIKNIESDTSDNMAFIPLLFALQKQVQEFKVLNKSLDDENKLLEIKFLKITEELGNFIKEKAETDKNVEMLDDEVGRLRKLKESYVCEKWRRTRINCILIALVVLVVAISYTLLGVGTDDKELGRELKEAESEIDNYKEKLENLLKLQETTTLESTADKQKLLKLNDELNKVKDISFAYKDELVILKNKLEKMNEKLKMCEKRNDDQNALLNEHFSEQITSKGHNTLEINLGFAYLNLVGVMALLAFIVAVLTCWFCGMFAVKDYDRRQRIKDFKTFGIK